MAIYLWNQLRTQGIKSVIKVGSVRKDMAWLENYPKNFLREIDHVWLLFEVENDKYLPLETTGGFIVFSDSPNCDRYFIGPEFDNPRQFKRFMEARDRYFDPANRPKECVTHSTKASPDDELHKTRFKQKACVISKLRNAAMRKKNSWNQ